VGHVGTSVILVQLLKANTHAIERKFAQSGHPGPTQGPPQGPPQGRQMG
jgi:hypothetical protein